MKRLLSIILALLMLMSVFAGTISVSATDEAEVDYAPDFATGGLYVQGVANSKQAWQQWSYYYGLNAESGVKYFFLSAQAEDNYVNIYNAYEETVVANGVTIASGTYESVPYVAGEKATAVKSSGKEYTYVILKSDSSASIYVNDTTGYYEKSDGTVFTDFYSFLIDDKANSVKGSNVAVVTSDGLTETTLKKIKGRGNTNWYHSEKKQYNLTFNSTMTIDGISCKKFSLVNCERDGAIIRNKIVYDVANEVGSNYAADTRYIDLYMNGVYRGCFQLSMKVEMGKNSLIKLKDTADDGVTEDFNFAVEVDIWNYGTDTHFTSLSGQVVALNTPSLDDYDSSDPTQKAQMDFIKGKYYEFENALYNGNMAQLEAICDVESLAKAYLIQEWSKNCDGGYTSTYYTYKADEGKFYAAPVWDFDSGLGNVDCTRAGASTSTVYYYDWLTKTINNKGTEDSKYTNTLGQAFNLSGTTSDGKNFTDYVKETWKNDFIPAIKVIVGQAETTSTRLKSIENYIAQNENAFYNNYVMWGFAWSPQKGLGVNYPNSFEGQVNYLTDWIIARTNWMTTQLLGSDGEQLSEIERDDTTPSKLEKNEQLYLAGTGFGGWDSTDYPLTVSNDRTTASIEITLQPGETYRFKVAKYTNGVRGEHYGADYTDEVTAQYFYEDTSTASCNVKAYDVDEPVTLTIEFVVKNGNFTAKPVEDITVYYVNSAKWENPHFFYWSEVNSEDNMDWPGVMMTATDEYDANGNRVYSATVKNNVTGIIFNDGLSIQKTKDIFDYSNGKYYDYTFDKWYDSIEELNNDLLATDITLYYVNSAGWETPYYFYWGGSDEEIKYPGLPMTETDMCDKEGNKVYSCTVKSNVDGILFNDSKVTKSEDLTVISANMFYDYKTQSWYNSLDELNEALSVKDITVYFVNSDKWDSVNYYYWGGSDRPMRWPGKEATLTTLTDGEGNSIYSAVIKSDVTGLIFNDGTVTELSKQTDDILFVYDGQYYDCVTRQWYKTLEELGGVTPTQPSETTEPSESDPSESTAPNETDPSEPIDPSENPTEPASTEPNENTEPTEATQPTTAAKKSSLKAKSVSLKAGKTATITVKNANGVTPKYSVASKYKKIIKVTSKGKVTALQKGTGKVTVKVGKTTLTYTVKVTNSPKFTNKNNGTKTVNSVTVKKGKTVKVYIYGKASTIKNSYSSNNKKIAKVSGDKSKNFVKVKGVKKGTTKIKVKVNGVKTITLKVTVK